MTGSTFSTATLVSPALKNRAALQRVRFAHSLATGQMTDSDEDGVFEQTMRSLDPEWRAGSQFWSAFGPQEDAKRQNLTRAIE